MKASPQFKIVPFLVACHIFQFETVTLNNKNNLNERLFVSVSPFTLIIPELRAVVMFISVESSTRP